VSPRVARVRFCIDADILGFGQVIASLRNDVTFPGDPGAIIHQRERPRCPITSTELLDTEWIPEVARRGWVIITRDHKIAQNRSEIAAVRDNNAKMAALNQEDAANKWGHLEVFNDAMALHRVAS
jgi:hypothetical protein